MILHIFIYFFTSCWVFAGVTDLSDEFAIGVGVVEPRFSWQIQPQDKTQDVRVQYKPNIKTISGPVINIWGIGVSYLTSGNYREDSVNKFGKTSYEDIRLIFFPGEKDQFEIAPYYSRYKGFYINNSSEIDGALTDNDPRLRRSDLEIFNVGGRITYYFSPNKYSAAALTAQTAIQTESGGSFFITGFHDGQKVKGLSALIPSSVQTHYGTDQTFIEGQFVNIGALLGYGHTFIWKSLFVNISAGYGRGAQQQNYKLSDREISRSILTSPNSFTWGFGYNSKRIYAGFVFRQNQLKYRTESLVLFNDLNQSEIFIVGRF